MYIIYNMKPFSFLNHKVASQDQIQRLRPLNVTLPFIFSILSCNLIGYHFSTRAMMKKVTQYTFKVVSARKGIQLQKQCQSRHQRTKQSFRLQDDLVGLPSHNPCLHGTRTISDAAADMLMYANTHTHRHIVIDRYIHQYLYISFKYCLQNR